MLEIRREQRINFNISGRDVQLLQELKELRKLAIMVYNAKCYDQLHVKAGRYVQIIACRPEWK